MLLLNGERITATHFRPSPMVVGMHLARLPRFGGSLVTGCEHWSVLHHTFLVCEIARRKLIDAGGGRVATIEAIEIAALMHDATEIAVCDVPSPFKVKQVKELEKHLLDQLISAWGAPALGPQKKALIKEADLLALLSEASRVSPPGLLRLIIQENLLDALPEYVSQFDSYRDNLLEYGRPSGLYSRDDLVEIYRNKVYHLLHEGASVLSDTWGLQPDPYGKINP